MKPLNQHAILIRLLLITSCWLIIQLLLLPYTVHQNDLVLTYSSVALLGLILAVTGYDTYRVSRHTKAASFILVDLLTLVAAAMLLFI
ncbi:hypothetical protein [Lactiplantibacillus daowaiensis]|uniref:Integral membrane protein n=1 Tax=Lactiplantibacillus daowaiensis TaxID=2559918 RepID=A0ABW1RXC9_9LACO|nr:hypothetical protein [Lactiplantibacillus daowaiensis]